MESDMKYGTVEVTLRDVDIRRDGEFERVTEKRIVGPIDVDLLLKRCRVVEAMDDLYLSNRLNGRVKPETAARKLLKLQKWRSNWGRVLSALPHVMAREAAPLEAEDEEILKQTSTRLWRMIGEMAST